jgi:hypothetical protein
MKNVKHVIWIDQNNGKEENKGYLKRYSEELKDFSFTLVTSVQEGYSLLSKFRFEIIYIILSGRLAEEFLDIYEENLQRLTVLTLNIIFCFNGKYHELKKYANDPFYNPGGVVTEFEEVIHFLKMDKNDRNDVQRINEQNKYNNLNNDKTFTFIPNSIENISLPIILKKFSSRFINEDEMEKFKRFLKTNYYNSLKENGLINFFDSKIKIPYYLFSKIFIRLYTMESPFYRDLNKALRNGNFSDFNQFIFTLYYGLNQKIIKSFHDKYLYRSTKISINELDKIYSSHRLVLTNTFLSFTKNKNIAIKFVNNFNNNERTLKTVLFVVNPLNQNNLTVTNMDVNEFSFFCLEEEVTFLPFSGFEIVNIEEGREYITMHLNYLNKYEKKVIDYIDARSKDRVEVFLKELVEGSSSSIFKDLISDKSIKLIEDYRNKKNVLWIDQYSRCKVYDNYIKKYSENLKNFYFERATTIKEAFTILSNYEFKMVHIIINDKLSKQFFSEYIDEIKKLGVVTANIIFCDEDPKEKSKYLNDPFLNPGKVVTDFSKVVNYLNIDECGFNNILKMNKTIDSSFTGKNYGNIFKGIKESQIVIPKKMIDKIILNLPSKEAIDKFKNFIYKYGRDSLSKVVNPSQEKKIELPLFIYPKFYMRMYGLQTDFYYDINKYLSNQENDFGIFNTFVTILYYGLSQNLLISNDEFPFYRGGVISKNEFKLIEKNNFYSCKNFLSFSKSEKEADKFLNKNLGCDNSLYPTKFIIEKCGKKLNGNNLMSNIEMRHYSGFASEQEVLFLPLSCFEVTSIDNSVFNEKNIKIIKLNYVGMHNK